MVCVIWGGVYRRACVKERRGNETFFDAIKCYGGKGI
jgi:hypothetical protein